MSTAGSVSVLMGQLSDKAAQQELWQRYYHKLVALARRNLHGFPLHTADEEDVALSAFDSFFRAAEKGRFPQLEDRDDLWKVLMVLTLRKASNLKKYEKAAVRNADRVQLQSELESLFLNHVQCDEPDPQLAVAAADSCRALLQQLPDDQFRLREIAVFKMEGYTNPEIATRLDVALSTVELRLKRIRTLWSAASDASGELR